MCDIDIPPRNWKLQKAARAQKKESDRAEIKTAHQVFIIRSAAKQVGTVNLVNTQ